MIHLLYTYQFFLCTKKTPIFKDLKKTPLVKFLYFGWAALRYPSEMYQFYQMYEKKEEPLTYKVILPGLGEFFAELDDIDWELRTLDEFRHYDVTLYKSILKNATLEDFGIYTWSFKQIFIFLIFIGDGDFVKQQLMRYQEVGLEKNGLELFMKFCDFVKILRKYNQFPTLENGFQVAKNFYNLPSLEIEIF